MPSKGRQEAKQGSKPEDGLQTTYGWFFHGDVL
jgi:hypothetical protein